MRLHPKTALNVTKLNNPHQKEQFLDAYILYIYKRTQGALYMLFTTQNVKDEELKSIVNFFEEFDAESAPCETQTCVSKYITSLVSGQYQKSVEEIQNTKVGNRVVRKRSLQQVMQESFFYGANRFGNNFIA